MIHGGSMFTFQAAPRFGKTTMGRLLAFATTGDAIKSCMLLGGNLANMQSHNSVLRLFRALQGSTDQDFAIDLDQYELKSVDSVTSLLAKALSCLNDNVLSESNEEIGPLEASKLLIASHDGQYLSFSDFMDIAINGFELMEIQVKNGSSDLDPNSPLGESFRFVNTHFPFIAISAEFGPLLFFFSNALLDKQTYNFEGFPYLMIGESSVIPPTGVIANHVVRRGLIPLRSWAGIVYHPFETVNAFYKLNRCFGDSISSQLFSATGPALSGGASSSFLASLQVSNINECIGYYAPVFRDQSKDPFLQLDLSGYTAGDLALVTREVDTPSKFDVDSTMLYGTSRKLAVKNSFGDYYYDREILVPFYDGEKVYGNSLIKVRSKNGFEVKTYKQLFNTDNVYNLDIIENSPLGVTTHDESEHNGYHIHVMGEGTGQKLSKKGTPDYVPIKLGSI